MNHDAWAIVLGFGSIGITVVTFAGAAWLVYRNWRNGR